VNASNATTLIPTVIPPHPRSPDGRWLASFPLRSFLELGAYVTAPGSARGHVRNVLTEWRLGAFEENVTLIVSEIVTNSVVATGRARWKAELPPVRLWLLAGPDGVLVAVWDAVPDLPVLREAGELDENGRGLWIVQELSAQCDCYLPPAPHIGKVTRALISNPVITFP
jgi:anti-sigma regulatory factor (Ser/Thr protein kinase)